MPLVMPLGKIHVLEKLAGLNESAERSFAPPVNILAKRVKKKYVNFSPSVNREEINAVIYTQAQVDKGDRIDGMIVVEVFENGKYGLK